MRPELEVEVEVRPGVGHGCMEPKWAAGVGTESVYVSRDAKSPVTESWVSSLSAANGSVFCYQCYALVQ